MSELENKEAVEQVEETVVSEEEKAEREKLFNIAIEKINSLGLNWTFRSIEFIVNREGITFNQLRSCVFKTKDNDVKFDIELATKYIIAAGLVNPKTCSAEDYKDCLEKAYDIMENWRDEFGFVGILQILLVNTMESKHFFMGAQDVKILEHLAYKNLQKDLVMSNIAIDMQTKITQSQAMQS